MKSVITLLGIALSVVSVHPFNRNKQDEIIGVWQTHDAQVVIHRIEKRYIGNPVNPDGEKNQKIEILNLEYQDGKWIGKIYSVKKDKTFNVTCEVAGDKLLLEVHAGFVSAELEWTRIADPR